MRLGKAVRETTEPRSGTFYLGLGTIALLPRLIAAIVLGDRFHFVDGADYMDVAVRILSGEGFPASYERNPAYPVFLAALEAILPDRIVWIRLAQASIVACAAPLLYHVASRMVGPRPALVAALLYALDPLLVIASGLLYPEAAAALLFVLATGLAWRMSQRDGLTDAVGLGVLVGVLVLLRPVAAVFVPLFAFWVVACLPSGWRQGLLRASALVLACVVVLAPWTVRNYQVRGELQALATYGSDTHGGVVRSVSARAWDDPKAFALRCKRNFLGFWELYPTRLSTDRAASRERFHEQDPRLPLEPSFKRSLRDTVSALSFLPELAFALAGLALASRRHRRAALLLASLILSYGLGYALFVGKIRYRIPVLPLLFVFSGIGATALLGWLSGRMPAWRRESPPMDG